MAAECVVHAPDGGPSSHRSESGAQADPRPSEVASAPPVQADQRPDAGPLTGLIGTAAPASASIDDALLAARTKLAVAENRLAESHDEAQSIIRDAVEQATLIAGKAELAGQQLLVEARREAEGLTAAAQAVAKTVRHEADQMMAGAQTGSRQLRERMTADLTQQLADQGRELENRSAAHDAELASSAAASAERIAKQHGEADAATENLLQSAGRELENARLDVATARSDVAAEVRQLLETARAGAAREMTAAAEQTVWTQQIIAGLLEAADLDSQHIRKSAHEDAAAAIRRTHARLAAIVAASRDRMGSRLAAAEQEAQAIGQRAATELDRAGSDAIQAREEASADARGIVAEATDTAAARLARADRRLVEAEAGAGAIREQVAEELTRTQREIQELRRSAKSEERQTIDAARAEADALRATARQLLADARAEVAALTARRNAIAGELGNLSGVIEALAVSDAPQPSTAPPPAEAPSPEPAASPPAEADAPHRAETQATEHSRADSEDPDHDNDASASLVEEIMRPE